jgi:hypothetical protein
MNPGFPADFSDEPDDSEYAAQGIIEIEEKRLGRKLTKKERRRIVDSVTPEQFKRPEDRAGHQ